MKYSLRSLMTFSIRDLLWLTVVVALSLGWWMDSSTRISRMSNEIQQWKGRAEASRELLEYSSGRVLEWSETMPTHKPPYHGDGPLRPVEFALPVTSAPGENPPHD